MPNNSVSVWYDEEGDMLEVLWAFREGYFEPTEDERILKRLDDDGAVIGFLIHEMSTLKRCGPVEFELAPETPANDVANVTTRQAAIELGVSERRVRQLAREGRGARRNEGRGRVADSGAGRACPEQARPRRSGRARLAIARVPVRESLTAPYGITPTSRISRCVPLASPSCVCATSGRRISPSGVSAALGVAPSASG